jgi:hypothetical protein
MHWQISNNGRECDSNSSIFEFGSRIDLAYEGGSLCIYDCKFHLSIPVRISWRDSVHPNTPLAWFSDFTKMALDESKHLSLLTSCLSMISHAPLFYGTEMTHWRSCQRLKLQEKFYSRACTKGWIGAREEWNCGGIR